MKNIDFKSLVDAVFAICALFFAFSLTDN